MAYQEGDTSPPHINVHNEVVSKLAEISAEYDLDLVLPPQRNIGDTEHVKDHNLITDALQAIDDWEAAGGGAPGAAVIGGATGAVTKSSFTENGQAYDVYEFLGSGELVVSEPGLADVLVVAGGGGGGGNHGGGGGGGGVDEQPIYLLGDTHKVVVGGGGASNPVPRQGNSTALYGSLAAIGGGAAGSHTSNWEGKRIAETGGSSGGNGGNPNATNAPPPDPVVLWQGNRGGTNAGLAAGGGGGAGGVGADASRDITPGRPTTITGSGQEFYVGCGGGGSNGGTGNTATDPGSGGGGAGQFLYGASGLDGICIVRVQVATESYPFRTKTTAPRTAHAARIEDGIVRQVIVIPHLDDDDAKITAYCNRIGLPGTWVDTSYTGSRRGKYAGIGDTFVSTKAGGEFISPIIEEEPVTLDLPGEEQ